MANATGIEDVLNLTDYHVFQCDDSLFVAGAVGILAVIIAFAGYRIYTMSLGLCGFVGLASISAVLGLAWRDSYEGDKGQDTKLVIVAVFILLWGAIGAGVCVKTHQVCHKILGFLMGAAVGVGAVCLLVFVVSASLKDVPEEYAGWEVYTVVVVSLPAALCVGYLMRNMIMYAIMAATALGGSLAGTALFSNVVTCGVEADISTAVWTVLALIIAAIGFAIQCKFRPEAKASVNVEGKPESQSQSQV